MRSGYLRCYMFNSLQVEVKGDLTVEWKVPCASKSDEIGTVAILVASKCMLLSLLFAAIYNRLGCSSISSQYNRKEETEGSLKMKVRNLTVVFVSPWSAGCRLANGLEPISV